MSINTYIANFEESSSQYASRVDTASLSIVGDITIEAWIKLQSRPSVTGHDFHIVSKDDGPVGGNRSYAFLINSASNQLFAHYYDSGSAINLYTSTTGFTATDVGKWIHVAMTLDVSEQACTLYKNGGTWAGSFSSGPNGNDIKDTTADFSIGARPTSGGYSLFFDGQIDDVRVWSDIRTQREIRDNRDIEIDPASANLVGYWKLNNDWTDETANSNDLTPSGSPTFVSNGLAFADPPSLMMGGIT